jgi:hypothetical protein
MVAANLVTWFWHEIMLFLALKKHDFMLFGFLGTE